MFEKQGMIFFQNCKKQPGQQLQSWEKLLEDIPKALKVLPMEAQDLKMNIQSGCQITSRVAKTHEPLHLSQLRNKSKYEEILDEMPYLELKNQGSTQSDYVKITVFNPTGSSMAIKPRIVPLTK